jgi:hypothetical protein
MPFPDNFMETFDGLLAEAGLDLRQMFQEFLYYESSLGFVPYKQLPEKLTADFNKLAALLAFKLLQIQHDCFEDLS